MTLEEKQKREEELENRLFFLEMNDHLTSEGYDKISKIKQELNVLKYLEVEE